ncbi:MAG: hypothetical protein IIX93_10340 [Clostridia bacterium]|nr:hypothetical protein [Clostridia bacterium]
MNNQSLGKKFIAAILAILFGLSASGAFGLVSSAGMYLSVLSVFSSMFLAFLFGYGGIFPASLMALTMLVSGFAVGGWMIPAYLLLIGILPGAVMIYGSKKGIRFFAQVRNAMIAILISFVILVLAIRSVTGQDFASFFKTMFDEMISTFSMEEKDAFAQYLNQIINQIDTQEAAVDTENILAFFSDGMEQTISLLMPVSMIIYAVLNGALGVLWMNWLRQKHGESNVEFVPVRGWRLSKQVTLGLAVVFVAVLIIGKNAQEAGISARIMAGTAIICAACIQASASFLSRLTVMGVSVKKRTLFLVVFILLTFVYFPFYGIMSALFGSKGLFTPKVRFVHHTGMPKNMDEKEKNENEEDNNEEDE